jgi:hypothetical protein
MFVCVAPSSSTICDTVFSSSRGLGQHAEIGGYGIEGVTERFHFISLGFLYDYISSCAYYQLCSTLTLDLPQAMPAALD